MKQNYNRKGFTIVELVIVIAVIAILAAVLIPTFGNVIEKAQNSAAIQEAVRAYTEYIIDHAEEGVTPEYLFYKKENKVVVLKSGAALGVYNTEEEAIKEVLDNPETPEDESHGYTLNTLEIDGLYFMQSGEESEEPENDWIIGKPVGYIGDPNETKFEVFTGNEQGIYVATIKSNTHYSESLFFYYPYQFISLDVPEIINLVETKNIKGIKLNTDHKLKTLTSNDSTDMNINVTPGKTYTLTLNFRDMVWSIEEIK